MKVISVIWTLSFVLTMYAPVAWGEVRSLDKDGSHIMVKNEAWQPEGIDEALIVRAPLAKEAPTIDGRADDPAWLQAEKLTVPLAYGSVKEATIKALYTENDVFLLVSWPDATKDDQHHPWVWDDKQGRYIIGPQVEDSLLVSLEGGCDWNPSLLAGNVYDFDGWLWMAARSDPIGQAVDVDGAVRERPISPAVKIKSRSKKPFWNMKFSDLRKTGILTTPWQDLERAYKFFPVIEELYVRYQPDGSGKTSPAFVTQLPAPESKRSSNIFGPTPANAAPSRPLVAPQYKPVKLEGDAGDVAAKGRWENGRWTVEFRRARITPGGTVTDSKFYRVTQFSIHIFDHTERLDESSESGRLWFQFEPAK